MVDIQVSSGGTTDTSNKNTDFFAALASTSEQVEQMEASTSNYNYNNSMSVVDYKRDKQLSNSEIYEGNNFNSEINLIPTDLMTAITPLLKFLEKEGKIKILESNSIQISNPAEEVIQAILGSNDEVKSILEDLDYDEDRFLDRYWEDMYEYLNEQKYTDADIDIIVENVLEDLFRE